MKKLLFITHDASRTGAPILLLNLIKWIKEHKYSEYRITLLICGEGSLIPDFSSEVITIQLSKKHTFPFYRLNRVLDNIYNKTIIKRLKKTKWDLIFSNTIVNGKGLEKLKTNDAPIITYVHELKYSIDNYLKMGYAAGSLQNSKYFICGSKLVQETLVNNFDIDKASTEVIRSFGNIKNKNKDIEKSIYLKKELNIPNDSLVVAMAGSFYWRKGSDLFVKTATLLDTKNICFLWIGADNIEEMNKVNYDLLKIKSTANIKFIPSSSDYAKYFNLIDVFYLSSREDPYPLVMVEATSYGIPIICFKDAGGTQEFIDSETGYVVPYGDLKQVSEKIKFYNENRNILHEKEIYIKEKSLKFPNVDDNASKIFDIIELITNKNEV